jgi:hypothetical protein
VRRVVAVASPFASEADVCVYVGARVAGCGRISIAAEPLEDFVKGIVITLLVMPTTLWNIEQHARHMATEDLSAIRLDVEAKRARLLDLAMDGLLSKAELKDRLRRLDDDRKHFAMSKTAKVNLPTTLPALHEWWDGASVTARAEMCALVLARIVVAKSTRPQGSKGLDTNRLDVELRDYSLAQVAERAWR